MRMRHWAALSATFSRNPGTGLTARRTWTTGPRQEGLLQGWASLARVGPGGENPQDPQGLRQERATAGSTRRSATRPASLKKDGGGRRGFGQGRASARVMSEPAEARPEVDSGRREELPGQAASTSRPSCAPSSSTSRTTTGKPSWQTSTAPTSKCPRRSPSTARSTRTSASTSAACRRTWASRPGSKRSLNVSLDFADTKQRLYGYKTLNLLNSHDDPTLHDTVLYSHIARQVHPGARRRTSSRSSSTARAGASTPTRSSSTRSS